MPGPAQDQLNKLDSYFGGIGLGMAGHEAKHDLKAYDEDPASLATMALSKGAVDEREAAERGGFGSNALIGAGGGEQANLLQNNMAHQRDARQEQVGLNAIDEANAKRQAAMQTLQSAINSRRGAELGTLGMENNLMSTLFDARRRGGLFSPDTFAKSLSAFGQAAAGI